MVAAVILAAGGGARLGGRCKAALRLPDGRTYLEAIAAAARAGGAAPLVLVLGGPHEAEAGALAPAGAIVARNPAPARGMLSSLAAGLEALADRSVDSALVWPVDHPFVDPSSVAAVLAAATRRAAVIPTHGGRGGHPTAFGRDLWPALAAAVDAPGGARAVLASMPGRVVRVAVDDPGILRDIDVPGDLA